LHGPRAAALVFRITFAVNTFAHLIGSRQYATADGSRNSFLHAALTMGDGWHNNHHHYPYAAQAGFRWYEIDGVSPDPRAGIRGAGLASPTGSQQDAGIPIILRSVDLTEFGGAYGNP
jgi:hypothetical protein